MAELPNENELVAQLFKANSVASIIVDKQSNRTDTLKKLHETISKMHTNIISRSKCISDIDVQEFSDFYLIKYTLSDFEYTLD